MSMANLQKSLIVCLRYWLHKNDAAGPTIRKKKSQCRIPAKSLAQILPSGFCGSFLPAKMILDSLPSISQKAVCEGITATDINLQFFQLYFVNSVRASPNLFGIWTFLLQVAQFKQQGFFLPLPSKTRSKKLIS